MLNPPVFLVVLKILIHSYQFKKNLLNLNPLLQKYQKAQIAPHFPTQL
jgi:hypothetical protein